MPRTGSAGRRPNRNPGGTDMSLRLLTDRRFWPYFWTQFFGAFNDNVFKNALVVMITYRAIHFAGWPVEQMVALCGGVFILPFLLFSAFAGQLADKCSKSRLVVWIKAAEIPIMLAGALGFITQSIVTLLAALFCMGLQSSFFGPVKYSILPQLLRDEELLGGNAYVETGTFLAILLGTVAGGLLVSLPDAGLWAAGSAVVLLSVLGLLSAARTPHLAPEQPELRLRWNPMAPVGEILAITRRDREVFLAVLGISWFWFLGAAVLSLLPPFCRDRLHAEEPVVTFFLALFSVGIGLGALLCERLGRRGLALGLVPLGSLGLSLFSGDLFFAARGAAAPLSAAPLTVGGLLSSAAGVRISADLLLFAVSAGFFTVPLYTFMQKHTPPGERSRIVAGNNILNALFMVTAALALMAGFALGMSVAQGFLILAVVNAAVAFYIYAQVPEFLYQLVCRLATLGLYRLKVTGGENIPAEGPAVLVSNHVSFIDWLIIGGVSPRPVRFVMHHGFFDIPLARRIFRDARVIPIAGLRENPAVLSAALERISQELAAGHLVCIFPEGRLTADGEMGPFRPGIEWILQRSPVPVVPMALKGMWGSFFSRKYGRAMTRPFRRFYSRITLVVGRRLSPQEVTAEALRSVVGRLLANGTAA
jgi:hypothetical protein